MLWVARHRDNPQVGREVRHTGTMRVAGLLRGVNLGRRQLKMAELRARMDMAQAFVDHLVEALDFTGRHEGERSPQRHQVTDGLWLRESRGGRPVSSRCSRAKAAAYPAKRSTKPADQTSTWSGQP